MLSWLKSRRHDVCVCVAVNLPLGQRRLLLLQLPVLFNRLISRRFFQVRPGSPNFPRAETLESLGQNFINSCRKTNSVRALQGHVAGFSCNSNEKAPRETQTLRTGRSNTEPKIFAPPQTPFPTARDGQNLISWRRSLPLPTNRVW